MLLPPSSTLRAKCIDTYVPAVKLQVQVLCFLKYMLTDVLQISQDAFFSFLFLFNRFNFFAEMYSPSGKRNAELFCSSFFCLVLVDFVFLAAVCLGLLCTILKPFTAFSEHFLTECRTLHLHLSIQRLRIGLCHSVNDPVMIWFMSLSFSHHSLIFCLVFLRKLCCCSVNIPEVLECTSSFVVAARPMTDLSWICQHSNCRIFRSANLCDEEKDELLTAQRLHLSGVEKERDLYKTMTAGCG